MIIFDVHFSIENYAASDDHQTFKSKNNPKLSPFSFKSTNKPQTFTFYLQKQQQKQLKSRLKIIFVYHSPLSFCLKLRPSLFHFFPR